MSVFTYFNKADQQPGDLVNVLKYIDNEAKSPNALRFCYGIGKDTALDDMRTLKVLYHKEKGRQYFHGAISFDRGVKKELAFEIAKEALSFFGSNWQISMVLHENTGNIHVHFVMNSVGIDGKKYDQSKSKLQKHKEFINRLLAEKSLPLIGEIQVEEDAFEDVNFCNAEDIIDQTGDDYLDSSEDVVVDNICIQEQETYYDTYDSLDDTIMRMNARIDQEIRERNLKKKAVPMKLYEPITFWEENHTHCKTDENKDEMLSGKGKTLIRFCPIRFYEEEKK